MRIILAEYAVIEIYARDGNIWGVKNALDKRSKQRYSEPTIWLTVPRLKGEIPDFKKVKPSLVKL